MQKNNINRKLWKVLGPLKFSEIVFNLKITEN